MPDRIRIIPHTPKGILYCGSFEIRFPDGRESVWLYWDDVASRRLRTEAMTQEQAMEAAKRLARTEQDALDKRNRK
jgi:hypothetical protein